jgi:hypothetical protein
MALQDPIAPRNNNEPLLGPIVGSSGEITHSYRNWLEYKRLQIGEIISGVNRNAVNIVQLETDYTAADGAVTSAYITADAVVEANAASARATLSTTLTAAYEAADTTVANDAVTYTDAQITIVNTAYAAADAAEASARTTLQANLEAADTALQANIDSEESARVTADTAEAAARTTLTAQVRGTESSLIQNAFFQEEFSGTGTPSGWFSWDNGVGTWAARGAGDGYAFAVAPAAASQHGIVQSVSVTAGSKFLASAEVRRTLGGSTLAGAGVLVQWLNSGGSETGRDSIVFATDATTSGVIDTAPDNVVRWEKEVTAPTNTVSVNLYAMGHYSTFGSIAAAAGFNWRECNLTPISGAQAQSTINAASITTNATAIADETTARAAADTTLTASVASNTASVSTNATAIADVEGNLTARYGIQVSGGGNNMALFSLETGTALGSQATLEATNFLINGNVLTTGTVQRTAMSSAERDALGAEGVAANFYRQSSDPGSVPDGSWWADTGNSELNVRISSAWQKIADIGGDQFRASGTSYLTAEVSGSGSGTATTSAPSITISGDVGSLTYLWRQKSTDTLVSCSNTAIINPTFSRSMSAAPASAVQTLWTLYVTDATLGETIQWDVIVNFTNSF